MFPLTFVNNITLIVALSIFYSLIARRWEYRSPARGIVSGLLFGAVAIAGMLNPFVISKGLIFDGRSIVISIAGFIGGWTAAAIAAVIAISYRISLGGPGTVMGVSVIVSSAAIGVAYYQIRLRRPDFVKPMHLLGFGLVVHIWMLVLTATLPAGLTYDTLSRIALPVIVIYPLGTLLLALVLLEQESRIKAEAALRKSEEEYRRIFDSAVEGFFQTTPAGKLLKVNPAMARMFGYESPEAMLADVTDIGRQLYADPGNRGQFIHFLETAGVVRGFEAEFRHREGRTIWVHINARVVRDEYGTVRYYEGTGEDMTARRQMQEELRESQRRLADIIDFLPDATLVIDRDGKVIAWNKAIETMTGIKAKDMLGKGDRDYAIPFYGERRPILIDFALHPEPGMENLYTTIRKVGDIFIGEAFTPNLPAGKTHLSATASVLRDSAGEVIAAIETIRDISERRYMEVALSAEHALLVSILDGIPVPTFVIDRDHNVIQWNQSNAVYTGTSKEDVMGKPLDLSFLNQGRNPQTLAELILVMSDDEILEAYSAKGVRKSDLLESAFECIDTIWLNGEERSQFIRASRLYNEQGEIIGAIQTAQDITERVKAGEERERLQVHLFRAQKMESIGRLAGGIAHDFNNILSAIMGYSELYKEMVRDRPKVFHSMEQVVKAAVRAKDLVKQILLFSRQTEQEKTPTMLGPILKEVAKFMRASLPATIDIRLNIGTASDLTVADPTKIHQVLMNLCTNAGHAMRHSGGILELGLADTVVGEENQAAYPSLPPGRYLDLFVRDTGCGIRKEDMEKIFEPYFTTRKIGEGTGLGLAVAMGIVHDHGGMIKAYSEPDKGSVFHVYLKQAGEYAGSGDAPDEGSLPRGNERILFIDDEAILAEMGKELLEALGYKVVAETDPQKAIEVFAQDKDAFDMVITDKTMPHMTGFDVARKIRGMRADIPIILCSGFQEKEDMEQQYISGITQFLPKPVRRHQLAEAVRRLLDGSPDAGTRCDAVLS